PLIPPQTAASSAISPCCLRPCSGSHRDLHSFPTRRSSDLELQDALVTDSDLPRVSVARVEDDSDEDALNAARRVAMDLQRARDVDRKSTRLNSSHVKSSYAVFCLKKKNGYRSRKPAATRAS